ncbi:MAG: hypothetical protein U5P41_12185 [Gammaproteobacteria bacterium]|nr:hypothetical protein [Gammaproteobacteria bacterium]
MNAGDAESDTALGDWYVNRIVVDRRPLLLLVSSGSLLSILEPARNVRELPARLIDMVYERLRRLGVDMGFIEREIDAMTPVLVGQTRDRSVLGQMVDFAKTAPYHLPLDGWDNEDLRLLESRLEETPCRLAARFGDAIFPADRASWLLKEKWGTIQAPPSG